MDACFNSAQTKQQMNRLLSRFLTTRKSTGDVEQRRTVRMKYLLWGWRINYVLWGWRIRYSIFSVFNSHEQYIFSILHIQHEYIQHEHASLTACSSLLLLDLGYYRCSRRPPCANTRTFFRCARRTSGCRWGAWRAWRRRRAGQGGGRGVSGGGG